MKGYVTINTDAGFYPIEKVGSYAYWIKADGLFLRGSGVFKDKCKSPWEAEMKALINAVHVLLGSSYIKVTEVKKIIFNRDNINTRSAKGSSNELERKLALAISTVRKRTGYKGKYPFFEYRHVKAHKHTKTPKHWVNDWCDRQCKAELSKWKLEQLKLPNNDNSI